MPVRAPRKRSPSSTDSKISPMPNKPDHRHHEVEALHEVRDTKRQAELTGDDVEPDAGEDEAEKDGHEGLQRIAAAAAR